MKKNVIHCALKILNSTYPKYCYIHTLKFKNNWLTIYEPRHEKTGFLAHLSRRLIGELIVYEGIRPSVRPSVVRPSVNIFKQHLL